MTNKILVDVEENYPVPSWLEKAESFADKVLLEAGYNDEEVSILFCSDSFIQKLNFQYRNIDSPTDVLSFENGSTYCDENGRQWFAAGDIVISLDTLPKNAEYFEVPQDEELRRLIVHGLLHLNGYDHGEEHVEKGVEPSCEMLKLQKKIMTALNKESII
ncbi:MAG: rRNA maturation RNase YbeY [Treponema sp.]|nr:rRNA maturation RNase YbeY [Treponema sp.]